MTHDDEIRYAHCMGQATSLLTVATRLKELAVNLAKDDGSVEVVKAYWEEADECIIRADGFKKQANNIAVKGDKASV